MIIIGNKNTKEFYVDENPVKEIYDNDTGELLWYYGEEPIPLTEEYFYIQNNSGSQNTIRVYVLYDPDIPGTLTDNRAKSIEWSKNKEEWTLVEFTKRAWNPPQITIDLEDGECAYFRNDNGYFSAYNWEIMFNLVHDYSVGGDIMSLINYLDKENAQLSNRCFSNLLGSYTSEYIYNDGLTDASQLILPDSTADYCYSNLFRGCYNLNSAPVLPATTLSNSCYYMMFSECNALSTPPVLPATTLAEGCYNMMFNGCSSITTAPVLRATTLVSTCYRYMFYGCSSLNSVTSYANNISANNCLQAWMGSVAASGTFHNLGSATYPRTTSGVPSGWTIVNN